MLAIDGSAPDRTLMTSAYDKYVSSISADGKQILATEIVAGSRVVVGTTDGSSPAQPWPKTDLAQGMASFSPDGRWIAFAENGGARTDVYLRSVSGAGGRRLVSADGGSQPRWTKGGREIVYLTGTSMMSAAVDPSTGNVGAPVELFRITDLDRDRDGNTFSYDVSADGQRFLVVKPVARAATQPLVVVLNWRPDMGSRVTK
jgi:Tol biopolymer transport system component